MKTVRLSTEEYGPQNISLDFNKNTGTFVARLLWYKVSVPCQSAKVLAHAILDMVGEQ